MKHSKIFLATVLTAISLATTPSNCYGMNLKNINDIKKIFSSDEALSLISSTCRPPCTIICKIFSGCVISKKKEKVAEITANFKEKICATCYSKAFNNSNFFEPIFMNILSTVVSLEKSVIEPFCHMSKSKINSFLLLAIEDNKEEVIELILKNLKGSIYRSEAIEAIDKVHKNIAILDLLIENLIKLFTGLKKTTLNTETQSNIEEIFSDELLKRKVLFLFNVLEIDNDYERVVMLVLKSNPEMFKTLIGRKPSRKIPGLRSVSISKYFIKFTNHFEKFSDPLFFDVIDEFKRPKDKIKFSLHGIKLSSRSQTDQAEKFINIILDILDKPDSWGKDSGISPTMHTYETALILIDNKNVSLLSKFLAENKRRLPFWHQRVLIKAAIKSGDFEIVKSAATNLKDSVSNWAIPEIIGYGEDETVVTYLKNLLTVKKAEKKPDPDVGYYCIIL